MRPRSHRLERMLAAYKGPACLSLTEAARIAGYKNPSRQGYIQKKRWPELFAAAEEEFRAGLAVTDEEIDQAVANLVRNPTHRDHYKGIELAARLRGRLDSKLTVNIERKDVFVQLDEVLAVMVARRQAQLAESNGDVIDVPAVAS